MAKGDIIPDGEILYRYVNPSALPKDQPELPPGIFQDKNLSCDWKKLQKNPESSFHVAEGKTLVVAIQVCEAIRNPTNPKRVGQVNPAWHQEIIHDPLTIKDDPRHGANEAHALVKGSKKKPVVDALIENSKIHADYSQ